MNLILVTFYEAYRDRIRKALEGLQVPGYTEFTGLSGSGETGRRWDTEVWPGRNGAVITVVPVEQKERVVGALRALKQALPERSGRHGGMKIFVLPVVEMA